MKNILYYYMFNMKRALWTKVQKSSKSFLFDSNLKYHESYLNHTALNQL